MHTQSKRMRAHTRGKRASYDYEYIAGEREWSRWERGGADRVVQPAGW